MLRSLVGRKEQGRFERTESLDYRPSPRQQYSTLNEMLRMLA